MSDSLNRATRLLQTVLPSFDKELKDNYRKQNVLVEHMSGTPEELPERTKEGRLLRESMGAFTPITVPGQRYNWITRGQTSPYEVGLGRGVITFAVPVTEMRAIMDAPKESRRLENFYEDNIVGTVLRYNSERTEHFFMGKVASPQVARTSNDYAVFGSCSPDFSTGASRGILNGYFSASAFTSQSTVTLNLAKNSAYDWATQYGNISGGWALNGPRVWSSTIRAQRNYSDDPNGVSQQLIGCADNTSYENISAYYLSRGTIYMTGMGNVAKESIKQQGLLMPSNVMLYGVHQISPANYTTAVLQTGVCYVFNTGNRFLKRFVAPRMKTMWTDVTWEKDPNSDNMRALVEVDEQGPVPWSSLAVHGLITGTAL